MYDDWLAVGQTGLTSTMNVSQAQVILDVGGLSHLMEAAAALARLTGQSPLVASHPQTLVPSLPNQPTQHQIELHLPRPQTATTSSITNIVSENESGKNLKSVENILPPRGIASGSKEIFPERLMAILNDSALSEVVTWLPHGRSFVIIRPDVFTEIVLPKYFPPVDSRSSSKYTSFTRKLNRWGFRQATRGADTGAFYHPSFQRDKPELCLDMVCQRFGGSAVDKTNDKLNDLTRKRTSPKTAKKALTTSALTKESLEKLPGVLQSSMGVPSTATTTKSPSVAVVSEDGRSTSSENTQSADVSLALVSGIGFRKQMLSVGVKPFVSGITNDTELTRAALQKRNETERLRAAKAMLYESYCRAIRGE